MFISYGITGIFKNEDSSMLVLYCIIQKVGHKLLSFYFIYIVLFSENLLSTCTIENSNGKKHTGVIYEALNNLTIFNYVLLFQRC